MDDDGLGIDDVYLAKHGLHRYWGESIGQQHLAEKALAAFMIGKTFKSDLNWNKKETHTIDLRENIDMGKKKNYTSIKVELIALANQHKQSLQTKGISFDHNTTIPTKAQSDILEELKAKCGEIIDKSLTPKIPKLSAAYKRLKKHELHISNLRKLLGDFQVLFLNKHSKDILDFFYNIFPSLQYLIALFVTDEYSKNFGGKFTKFEYSEEKGIHKIQASIFKRTICILLDRAPQRKEPRGKGVSANADDHYSPIVNDFKYYEILKYLLLTKERDHKNIKNNNIFNLVKNCSVTWTSVSDVPLKTTLGETSIFIDLYNGDPIEYVTKGIEPYKKKLKPSETYTNNIKYENTDNDIQQEHINEVASAKCSSKTLNYKNLIIDNLQMITKKANMAVNSGAFSAPEGKLKFTAYSFLLHYINSPVEDETFLPRMCILMHKLSEMENDTMDVTKESNPETAIFDYKVKTLMDSKDAIMRMISVILYNTSGLPSNSVDLYTKTEFDKLETIIDEKEKQLAGQDKLIADLAEKCEKQDAGLEKTKILIEILSQSNSQLHKSFEDFILILLKNFTFYTENDDLMESIPELKEIMGDINKLKGILKTGADGEIATIINSYQDADILQQKAKIQELLKLSDDMESLLFNLKKVFSPTLIKQAKDFIRAQQFEEAKHLIGLLSTTEPASVLPNTDPNFNLDISKADLDDLKAKLIQKPKPPKRASERLRALDKLRTGGPQVPSGLAQLVDIMKTKIPQTNATDLGQANPNQAPFYNLRNRVVVGGELPAKYETKYDFYTCYIHYLENGIFDKYPELKKKMRDVLDVYGFDTPAEAIEHKTVSEIIDEVNFTYAGNTHEYKCEKCCQSIFHMSFNEMFYYLSRGSPAIPVGCYPYLLHDSLNTNTFLFIFSVVKMLHVSFRESFTMELYFMTLCASFGKDYEECKTPSYSILRDITRPDFFNTLYQLETDTVNYNKYTFTSSVSSPRGFSELDEYLTYFLSELDKNKGNFKEIEDLYNDILTLHELNLRTDDTGLLAKIKVSTKALLETMTINEIITQLEGELSATNKITEALKGIYTYKDDVKTQARTYKATRRLPPRESIAEGQRPRWDASSIRLPPIRVIKDFTMPLETTGPVTSLEATGPVTSLEATRPVTSLEATGPVTSLEATRPVTSLEATRPVTSLEATRPVTSLEATRPNTEQSSRPNTGTNSRDLFPTGINAIRSLKRGSGSRKKRKTLKRFKRRRN